MNCKKCGATLKAGEPGAVITCEYCGHEERVAGSPAAPQISVNVQEVIASAARPKVKINALGCLVFIAIFAAVPIVICVNKSSKSSSSGPSKAEKRKQKRDKQWKLSELNNAPKQRWFKLDRGGMVGGLAELDAIANYQWALNMAKGWSADARLARMTIRRIRHDGVAPNAVNKRDGAWDVRFTSPSRVAAADKMAEVSEDQPLDGFRISIRKDEVQAMITNVSPPKAGNVGKAPVTCTYKQLVAAAKEMIKRPYYDASLMPTWQSGEWRWTINEAFGSKRRRRPRRGKRFSGSVHVDAKTCKRID